MSDRSREPELSGWAAGGIGFAATILGLIGCFEVVAGLVAVFDDEFYVVTSRYTFNLDTTVWGVVHIILGGIAVFVSYGLFTQAAWAGITTMVICTLAAIANFFFIPYYPIWSLVIIGLCVWVIWAITRPGGMR